MPNIESFKDPHVWRRAIEMTVAIYRLTTGFPPDERFGLTSQLRRASVSVASNIAEGTAGVREASISSSSVWPEGPILKYKLKSSFQTRWVLATHTISARPRGSQWKWRGC
jgi:hypothetical protein